MPIHYHPVVPALLLVLIGCAESSGPYGQGEGSPSVNRADWADSRGAPAEGSVGAVEFTRISNGTATGAWKTASPAGAMFQVDLPGGFNDFSQKLQAQDGAIGYARTVGLTGEYTEKYQATEIAGGPPVAADTWLSGLRFDMRNVGDVLAEKDVLVDGAVGFDIHVRTGDMEIIGRFCAKDDRKYMLTVEYPARAADAVAPDIARFLDSLELTRK